MFAGIESRPRAEASPPRREGCVHERKEVAGVRETRFEKERDVEDTDRARRRAGEGAREVAAHERMEDPVQRREEPRGIERGERDRSAVGPPASVPRADPERALDPAQDGGTREVATGARIGVEDAESLPGEEARRLGFPRADPPEEADAERPAAGRGHGREA